MRRVIVGGNGFHGRPDADGMIEIGLGVEEPFQGRRRGDAARHAWGWVIDQPGVRTLRYTVSPDNTASLALIARFGFARVGQQIDEEDGPEDIFELSVQEYRDRRSRLDLAPSLTRRRGCVSAGRVVRRAAGARTVRCRR
ncbi:MAG: GNAT family protein [Candidatus Nanopelagicales bacterium]